MSLDSGPSLSLCELLFNSPAKTLGPDKLPSEAPGGHEFGGGVAVRAPAGPPGWALGYTLHTHTRACRHACVQPFVAPGKVFLSMYVGAGC